MTHRLHVRVWWLLACYAGIITGLVVHLTTR